MLQYLTVKTLIFLVLIYTTQSLHAKCTRPIVVPASPIGKVISVDTSTGAITGIFPEVMREKASKFGCEFKFIVMPRARAEQQMAKGEADLLLASIKVPSRDALGGDFVPMYRNQWFLISNAVPSPPQTIKEIIDRPKLTLYVVRGFNYGTEYMDMLARLEKKKKVVYVATPEKVIRMMAKGRVAYTFLPTATFVGAMEITGTKKTLSSKITYTRVEDIPDAITGVYISKNLPSQDRTLMKTIFTEIKNEQTIYHRLSQIFKPEEMTSLLPLRKEDQ